VASGLLLRRGRSNAGQRVATQASTGAREELRTVGMHGKKEGQVHRRPAMAGSVERQERRWLGARARGAALNRARARL
jgi:hypothetical protein